VADFEFRCAFATGPDPAWADPTDASAFRSLADSELFLWQMDGPGTTTVTVRDIDKGGATSSIALPPGSVIRLRGGPRLAVRIDFGSPGLCWVVTNTEFKVANYVYKA
jgi:hypothetical protein